MARRKQKKRGTTKAGNEMMRATSDMVVGTTTAMVGLGAMNIMAGFLKK